MTNKQRVIRIDTDSDGERIDEPVTILVADVADAIYEYGKDLKANEKCYFGGLPKDERYGDIRVRVFDGTWEIHTGDAQYDQDHRGLWGAACVRPGISKHDAWALAIDLLEDIG
jgi:hypothetical protein